MKSQQMQAATRPVDAAFEEALALYRNGETFMAIASFQKVLELDPMNFDALHLLGRSANQIGQATIAESFFRAALSVRPDAPEAIIDLGLVLLSQGRLDQPLEDFLGSLGLKVDTQEDTFNIAKTLFEMGQLDAALHYCQKVVAQQADFLPVWVCMGMIYSKKEELHRAQVCFSSAQRIAPDDINVLNLLAKVRIDQGRPDDAVPYLEQVLAQLPEDELANTLLKIARIHLQDSASPKEALFNAGLIDHAEVLARDDLSKVDSVDNHNFLLKCYLASDKHTAHDYFQESRAWAVSHEHEESLPSPVAFQNDRDPQRRLRIGIVGDYFASIISRYTLYPLLKLYDRDHFEVYCYNFGMGEEELRPIVDHYRDIRELDGAEFFDLIQMDAIDIMLDINGRIRTPNYFETLLRQPAPIQVNWYNLPCTVGVKAYNYAITDEYCVRSGEESVFVEKIFRMPTGMICAWDLGAPPVVPRPPFETNGYVTFGCFGDFFKVNERVLATWGELLQRVPEAHLYLKSNNLRLTSERARVEGFFKQRGIDPARLILEGMSSYGQMRKAYEQVDIALDTFPYSSGSTTINALWQGVPVVAIEGNDWRGRSTAAVLAGGGLEQLIVNDEAAYISLAHTLARSPAQLVEWRANLAKRLAASPQWQLTEFVRNFESRLRLIWQDWLSAAK